MKPRILSVARLTFPLAAAIAAMLSAPSASALTYYWDSDGNTAGFGSTTGTWGTNAFWTTVAGGGATHSAVTNTLAADVVNFGTTLNYNNATVGVAAGGVTANSIVFGSGQTTGLTLGTAGGNSITLGGTSPSIVVNSTGHSINAPIVIGANTTISSGLNANAVSNFNLGAVSSSGTFGLTFTTPNVASNGNLQTITLTAASTYTGNTTIGVGNVNNGNSVKLGVANALPATVVTFNPGTGAGSGRSTFLDLNGKAQTLAGLVYTAALPTDRNIRVTSSSAATLTINGTTDRSFGGSNTNGNYARIEGAISLVKSGTMNQTLTGPNTYTGQTTVNAGTITVANATALGTTAGNTVVASGGRVFVGTSSLSVAEPFNITGTGSSTNGAINIGGSATGVAFTGAITLGGDATIQGDGSTSTIFSGGINAGANTLSFKESGSITVSTTGISGVGGSIVKNTGGTLTLSAANSYTGSTQINAGTLALSGSGDINSSSGITVNGATAKFLQTSSTALTPAITLTQGTLTGNGSVNTVNVGAGTGGIISNNNGVAGAALTIGALTFNGAATVDTFGNASAPIVTTSLASNAAGTVTINPSAASWVVGTPYDLISYGGGSIGGAGFAQFALGTVTGVTARQSKTLGNSGTAITLTIGADDSPYWAGDGDGKWNLASTNNWKLLSNNAYTTFIATDNVIFNDSATAAGPINVDIDLANVSPNTTTFNNPTKDYVLGSTGGFGIATGSLTKSGAGSVTLNNANTYTGGTTLNAGTLVLGNASAISTGSLTITGGTLDSSVASLVNAGNNIQAWNGDFTFAGTQSLNLGTGAVTMSANRAVTVNANTLTVGGAIGGGAVSLTKQGAGVLFLSANSTYTGGTTISAGTLRMASNRIGTSPTISIANGATLESTGGLTLTANQAITGTGTTGFVTTSTAGLLTTSGTTISTSGTLTFTRIDFRGAGNVISSGSILSGGALSGQRGLLVGNSVAGDLTINSGASITTSGSGSNAFDILGSGASGNGTLTINGGSYTATAGLATLQLGNGATSLGGGTLTLDSGSATIGTIAFQAGASQNAIVNLNGGTLTLNAITNTSGASRQINFNGGLFTAGANIPAFSGLTMNVKDGGANINTNGFSFAISDALLNDGTGGLTKSGLGTLTLSGANTYVGGTSVTGGTLRFSTAAAAATDVTVAGGAEAGALVAVNDGQWVNTGNLTLQNNGAALVDYGSTTPTTNASFAPIKVTDFVNGTTPGVRLAGATVASLAVSQAYPLVTWTGTGPVDGSAFDLRTHRLAGTFSVSSKTLFLTVTSNATGFPISWNTGNGNWDTSTANWVDSNLAATNYFDTLDSVLFGDAAGATGNPTVTLATSFSPLGVTMNTTGRNYTVSGAGSISGSGALTLAPLNTGTFTLATANNSFSGGTTVNGGTLALGHATNTLPDTGVVVLDGAAAILSLGSNSDTVGAVSLKNGASITGSGTLTGASYALESGSVSALLGGSGALTKSTSGTVTLSAANSFTGATGITGGTLRLADTGSLASSSIITFTAASSRLELGTDTAFTTLPQISGGSGAFTYTLVSDRATTGAGLTHQLGAMNGGNVTFSIISGANVTSGTAGITVSSSNMTSGSTGTTIINPTTATLTITGGVTSSGTNVARTLQLDGTGTGHSIGGVITQSVASALSLTKSNTSTWTLSGLSSTAASNYSGTTTIGEGTLAFTTTDPSLTGGLTFGATAGSTNVGSLDLSGSSATFAGAALVQTNSATANTITVGAGKTLTLNGGLTIGYDSGSLPATTTKLTVNGGGSMAVNGTTIRIGQGLAANNQAWTNTGTLDVTSLASFSTNVTNFNLGVGLTNGTGSNGILLLSNTANTLIATTLNVGDTVTENGGGGATTLTLGTGTNVIQADTIEIGKGKASGTGYKVAFASQTAGSPGTVTIANKAGSGSAIINIANMGTTATGTTIAASMDLRGHVSTVNASTLLIAQSNNGTGTNVSGSTGTVSFDAGTFTVGTLNMGLKTGASTGTATGTLNVGGGSFTVNTAFTLGSHSGAGASVATLNLTGGTFTSNADIVDGGGSSTSTVLISGGTLDMAGNDIGTLANPIILTAESGTLSNVASINGTGGLTKTTAGTLVVNGANPYVGDTTVSQGTLTLSSAAGPSNANTGNDASTVTIAAGATLNLTYAGTDIVDKLFIGATQIAAGVYGPSATPLAGIIGTGTLTVTTGPVGGYSSWQAAQNGGAGTTQTIDLDHDNDGVSNGVEYFLGGNTDTTGFTPLPSVNTVGGLSVTWIKAATYGGSYGTDFAVETSSTLTGPWTQEIETPNIGFTVTYPSATEVKFTFPTPLGSKNFARLKVTGP